MPSWMQRYEVLGLLRTVTMSMKGILDDHLHPHDISGQQGRIIGIVHEWNVEGKPVRQLDIQQMLGITGASTTSLLQGLERKGFISRQVSEGDGRAKELVVTEKGRELMEDFDEIFRDTQALLLRDFSAEERWMLTALLRRMIANVDPPA